ncbi:hypothetical protein EUTSA_v10010462mg [Eutrema salsugineum]|uniref:Uncharacterized protein n=1 Tax=Eutrema salsugineum TaxID=72664 RepID=V4LPD0_EUTSA|nr:UPF0496 protein At3g49070 [Eutrema salsugineum]ESQ45634.1 hypothetical protein EUTSA_v10010462mg [Eutrema salsugineum]
MGIKVSSKIKRILASTASGNTSPKNGDDVDVREEYANAFRTESYNQFWTRVIQLSRKKSTVSSSSSPIESSSTSSRLMSYRLFAHNLLDPDPNTITRILDLSRVGRPTRTLLSDYFLETANAFLLCTLLLKNVHRLRSKYESLKPKFQLENNNKDSLTFMDQFVELSRWFDPFLSSGSRIQLTRTGCLNLLKRLESSRDKTRAKLKLINGLTHSSGILVLALTTTLIVTIASHAFALFIAGPTLLTGRFKPVGLRNRLTKTAARLDVAAKGTYILSRDLDTISRLVTRINDEVEHVRAMAEFWVGRGSGRVRAGEEVARELKRCEESFGEELDELEEHIYLCFMTINRARNLVVRQILDSDVSPPHCSVAPKSK